MSCLLNDYFYSHLKTFNIIMVFEGNFVIEIIRYFKKNYFSYRESYA